MTFYQTTSNKITTLIIFSNSPGEISTWVRSVCEAEHHQNPEEKICVYLLPCQYATGQEHNVAARFDGVVEVLRPRQTWLHLAQTTIRRLFGHRTPSKDTAILSLGGDPFYAKWLAWAIRCPAYLYTEHRYPFAGFKKVFRSFLDGDLMGASVPDHLPTPGKSCLFLCGSRPQHFIHWFPIVAQGIAEIKKRQPAFEAEVLISPFLTENVVRPLLGRYQSPVFRVRYDADSGSAIAQAKLVVTIPGTNTAQAMYLRRPMIVFVPLNRPESMLLDGLPGLIGKVPVFGKAFMHLAVAIVKHKIKFYSKPNRLQNSPIVPEIVGVITPETFAQSVLEVYNDESLLAQMEARLSQIHIPRHSAETLWRELRDDMAQDSV
jgi:hypothetical protein